MNLTDYILEAADVTDVDMFDIEIEQTLAEIAVAEAMLDCIEKQDVLLEYNEDSAEEIITESSMLWVLEAAKRKKKTGHDEAIAAINEFINNWQQTKNQIKNSPNFPENEKERFVKLIDEKIKSLENAKSQIPTNDELKKMASAEKRAEKRAASKAKLENLKNAIESGKALENELAKHNINVSDRTKKFVNRIDGAITSLNNLGDDIRNEGKAFGYTAKGAAEEYKGKMNEFKSSAKGAANATGAFLTKVALGLRTLIANVLSLIFATKFDKLADKLEQMDSVVVEMNYTEATYLLRIGVVLKQLIPEFDNTVVKPLSSFSKPGSGTIENVDKACDTINKKIQTVVSGVKDVKKDKDSKSTVGAVDKDIIIDICRTLGNGEMKRTMNNIRFMIGKWNLEFEGIPKKTAQHVRKTFNKLNNFFGTAARAMSKIYKIAKKNDSVNKDIDLSKLDEGGAMYKSDFDAMVNEPINTDNDTKNESFSMKLSDEDFF